MKRARTPAPSRVEEVISTGLFSDDQERAKWLLDLLRLDFGKLTKGQRLDLQDRAVDFCGDSVFELGEDSGGLDVTSQRPTVNTLSELRDSLGRGLQRLHQGETKQNISETWELAGPIRYGIARAGDRVIRWSQQGTFRDLFTAAMFDVVRDYWKQLRPCLRCGTPFLRSGKRIYCSPICSSRTRQDRFTPKGGRKRPAVRRDYRAEHERRMKGKLGPNVKTQRRRKR